MHVFVGMQLAPLSSRVRCRFCSPACTTVGSELLMSSGTDKEPEAPLVAATAGGACSRAWTAWRWTARSSSASLLAQCSTCSVSMRRTRPKPEQLPYSSALEAQAACASVRQCAPSCYITRHKAHKARSRRSLYTRQLSSFASLSRGQARPMSVGLCYPFMLMYHCTRQFLRSCKAQG